ncbi:hypothetical protein ACFQ0M_30195 [Kitasatospora aburaviensis]
MQLRHEPPSYDTPPPGPVVTDTPAPAPEPKRKGVSWKALLVVALVMALGGTAGGVVLMKKLGNDDKKADNSASAPQTPGGLPAPAQSTPAQSADSPAAAPSPTASKAPSASPSKSASPSSGGVSAPARPSGYTPALEKVSLAIPGTEYASDAYRIDLNSGKVVPRNTNGLKWGLGVKKAVCCGGRADSFDSVGDGESDFAVISDTAVTPEQCAAAIDSRPDTDLSFNRVTAGRLLCIRDRTSQNIAIAAVEIADATSGAAKVVVSTWRANGQPGLS